jgi:hypothetical protein
VQAGWLEKKLKASTARWKVATFHHPIFSSANDRDNPRQREALLPVLKKYQVDLVLQGHDHTYARGTMPQTPERYTTGKDKSVDTMFVNSVSGGKMYKWDEKNWTNYEKDGVRLDRKAENTQFFQVIKIDGLKLSYEAWTADGLLYDGFTLQKDAKGKKQVTKGQASTMDPRMFANTSPYPGAATNDGGEDKD